MWSCLKNRVGCWNENWFKWRSVYRMTWPHHNTGSFVLYSLREVRWFFNVPVNHFSEEKGDGAYGLLYLPEKNRCQSRGSTFSSIFYDPECWPGLELEPATSSTPVRHSTTLVNQARLVKVSKVDSISFPWSLSFLFSCEKYFGNYISIRNKDDMQPSLTIFF